MDAISALHERVSIAKVTAPAPNAEQREAIFRAATRAADHKRLRPWRFLVIEGEGLRRLGDLFETAALEEAPDRKSTRLNSSHVAISYAVFCLKKKTNSQHT